jgi:hypothetical protein
VFAQMYYIILALKPTIININGIIDPKVSSILLTLSVLPLSMG